MEKFILLYGGLFAGVWIVFKLLRHQNSPFKNSFFWITLLLSSVGLTVFIFLWLTRNFFGAPPEDGWNRKFYEDGQLLTEFFAFDGKIEGHYKYYYPNGQLWFLTKYKNGVEVDTSYSYYENGQISSIKIFKDSKSISEINYARNGLKTSERYNPVDDLKGNYNITYFPNSNKEFETHIDNRSFEGIGIYYYSNGKIKYEGQYKDGRKNGIWVYLDSLTGNIIDRDTFDYKYDRQFKSEW